MEFKKGTIKHLQEYVKSKAEERGFADETVEEKLILLVEEVGELMKAYRKIGGIKSKLDEKDVQIGHEIADVINMVFGVGIVLGIDIEKEYLDKNKIVDQRVYKSSKVKK